MERSTLAKRLTACMVRGNLTIADLANWLDRPYPTVRTWVYYGRFPHGIYYEAIDARIKLLEAAIVKRAKIPVPSMSAHLRPAYIQQVRNELERGLSKANLA